MPCLEIVIPEIDQETKTKLADKLTKAFAKSTKFPTDIFGIRFIEYKPGETASGGKMWDGKIGRPYLHFLLYCPRIDRTAKQNVVKSFTKAYTESIGNSDWKPVIHICEHPYDNVGVEGELLSDTYEECAKSKFYYELLKD
ncbi:MAG: tautomerase family protein [bacterium]